MTESLQNSERLRQIRGIMVVAKMGACPLADLLAKSGVEKVLSHLPLNFNTRRTDDFKIVLSGGDSVGMDVPTLGADPIRPRRDYPFFVKQKGDFVNIGLMTWAKDAVGRSTPITIGIKGMALPDKVSAYKMVKDLFPNLTFSSMEKEPSFAEIRELASRNIIAHPPINFS